MQSSAGIPNPGLSLWVFKPLVMLGLDTQTSLSQGVAWVNLVALVALGVWATWRFPADSLDRETWLFAGALVAVNPLYIFLSRTVWAQSMAPPVALALWIGFMHRRQAWGAFLWGLASASLGQIHMIGFPLALATWLSAARNRSLRAWKFLLAGAAAGAWPLLFWLNSLPATREIQKYSLMQHLPGKVWGWWLAAESGLGVRYLDTNFWGVPFKDFLEWPLLGSFPTYGMLLALVGLTVLLAWPFLFWLQGLFRKPVRWVPAYFTEPTDTALLLQSAVFIFGILATLMPTIVFAHYFIVLFPAGSLWISRMWLFDREATGRRALHTMLALQFAVSLTVVFFVHQHFYDPATGFHFPAVAPL